MPSKRYVIIIFLRQCQIVQNSFLIPGASFEQLWQRTSGLYNKYGIAGPCGFRKMFERICFYSRSTYATNQNHLNKSFVQMVLVGRISRS